ncbi:hypothetical protein LEMLEM_LOCUS3536 [Lemmus lemmus]
MKGWKSFSSTDSQNSTMHTGKPDGMLFGSAVSLLTTGACGSDVSTQPCSLSPCFLPRPWADPLEL